MKRPCPGLLILLWLLLCCRMASFAGQPLLQHFTASNGLPSNVIYNVMQDSRGFLWLCTDHGICRYDGHEFTSFSLNEGLPDTEIFNATEDAYHRIWLVCYNKKPCYIFNNKICTAENDSLCRQLENGIYEYGHLNALFTPGRQLFCFKAGDAYYIGKDSLFPFSASPEFKNVISCFTDGGRTYFFNTKGLATIKKTGTKYILSVTKKANSVYSVIYNQKEHIVFILNEHDDEVNLYTFRLNADSIKLLYKQHLPYRVYMAEQDNDSTLLLSTHRGAVRYNFHADRVDTGDVILKGIPVTDMLKDQDGNYWFSTLNDGLYMQSHLSLSVLNKESGLNTNNVQSLCITPSGILVAGNNKGIIDIINKNVIRSVVFTSSREKSSSRVGRLFAGGNSEIMAGCERGLYKIRINRSGLPVAMRYKINEDSGLKHLWTSILAVKSIDTGWGSYFVATASNVCTLKPETDTCFSLWESKTTAVATGRNHTLWLGTIRGVYRYINGEISKFNADTLLSQSRITDIARLRSGDIIFGTQQYGLFLLHGNKLSHIDVSMGLSDNSCKRIFADENCNIWVCTNKGLDEITPDTVSFSCSIRHFSQSDGLPVNNVNDVVVKDHIIYIATSEGIITLSDRKETDTIPPPILITSVQTPDAVYHDSAGVRLHYNRNVLQINYTGIALCGGNDILYRYILAGGNTDTTFTRLGSVNFSALKPGNYIFYVWAKKKNGQWSVAPASFSFVIMPPFWQTYWFICLVLLLAGSSIFYLYKKRVQVIEKRETEKTILHKRMTELEMQALRAQINPHFVFNALNSIQHYYSRNDELSANEYMTSFARLIRQTFTRSQTHWITIAEEMDTLKTYIGLEQMRFKNAFTSEVRASEQVAADSVKIPAMLIQPYVENAIGHGLRHLTGGGKLLVDFSIEGQVITCMIQDNGIGFSGTSGMPKTDQHISKGMEITRKRIETVNQLYNIHITVRIHDLHTEDPAQTGTRVVISIPVKTNIIS